MNKEFFNVKEDNNRKYKERLKKYLNFFFSTNIKDFVICFLVINYQFGCVNSIININECEL